MEAATLTGPALVAIVGGLLLLVGALGLLRARDERVAGRVVAFAAMSAALYAAFDGAERATRREPADLRIVTTGSTGAPWLASRVGPRDGGGDVLAFGAGGGRLVEAGLAAALSASDAGDVVLVWDGEVEERGAWPRGPWTSAFTSAEPGPFEPGDLSVRVGGGATEGRPLLLEFDLDPAVRADLPDDAAVTFRLRRSDGDGGVDGPQGRIEAAALRAGAAVWTWPVAEAGAWTLSFELASDAHRVGAEGRVEVGPAALPVAVVGPEASAFAAALEAQAVPATVHDALPADLARIDVVVATGPLPADAALRLCEHVDRGGGLVVVGGPSGGALPLEEDPLAAFVPLRRQPMPPAASGGGSAGDRSSEGAPDPASSRPASGDEAPREGPEPAPEKPSAGPESDDPRGGIEAGGAPVTEAEVERRQVALVLVIDRSSSMDTSVRGIATRMDFAKRAAFETALRLEPGDELGVVAFGVRAYEVLPLGPVPGEEQVQRELEALRALDNQTILGGAVGRAYAWLRASKAAVRHAVILTDGDRLDAGDLTLAQSAARRMAEDGITVSVIQIADTAVGLVRDLNAIAQQGRGVFQRETDGSAIPRLVFAEVRRTLGAAGRAADGDGVASGGGRGSEATGPGDEKVETQPEKPAEEAAEPAEPMPAEPAPAEPEPSPPEPLAVVVLEEGPLVGPVPDDGLPELFGISPVVATPRARVLLATLEGTPLLASAHAGLGRVVAWSADVAGSWTAAWREDPLFPARLAAFVAAVRPADLQPEAAPIPTRTLAFEPQAPRRSVYAELTAVDGVEPRGLGELVPGPDRRLDFLRRRGMDLAFGAALGILALACAERLWRGSRV